MQQINSLTLLLKAKLLNSIDSKLQVSYDIFVQELDKELDQLKIQKTPEQICKQLKFVKEYIPATKKLVLFSSPKHYYQCKIIQQQFSEQQQERKIDVEQIKENIKELEIASIQTSSVYINVQFTFNGQQSDEEMLKKVSEELAGLNFHIDKIPANVQLKLYLQSQLTEDERKQYEQQQQKELQKVIQIEGKNQYSMKPQEFAQQSGYQDADMAVPEKIDFVQYINQTESWKNDLQIQNDQIFGELKTKLCWRKNNKEFRKQQK